MLVHLIADYGHGDLAFAEVRQRLATLLPEADLFATPVPAFDTISAGFCAAQLALGDRPGYRNPAWRITLPQASTGTTGSFGSFCPSV